MRACEIAAAELRYGRPVRLRIAEGDRRVFVGMALDTSGEVEYRRFASAAAHRHSLYLTRERAACLKLPATTEALVALEDKSLSEARDLGYRLEPIDRARIETLDWHVAPAGLSYLARLSRLSLLLPALVVAEIDADDEAFTGLAELSVADLDIAEEAENHFDIVARTPVPLRDVDRAEFVVFRGGLSQRDQIAIVVGEPDLTRAVPTRIHSSCLTGDLFGSLKCDCGDQLREGLKLIGERGGGVLLYLDQEGRGTGIGAKMMAYGYQAHGLDTIDADAALGFSPDHRRYGAAVAMLKGLGISSVELLTNNPTKGAFLADQGIEVTHLTPVMGEVTRENADYLKTKAVRAGHRFDADRIVAPANSK